jgi:predicted transcriptional regulator
MKTNTTTIRNRREALVIALYEKGKTYRQIAEEVKISPNSIKAILNKAGLDQSTSLSSRAYELFSKDKMTPLQVAIALGLEADEAIRLHQEYFKLLGCSQFTMVYLTVKDNPWPFVNLVNLAQEAGIDEQQLISFINTVNNDLPSLELKYEKLKKEMDSLEYEKRNLAKDNERLCGGISRLQTEADQLQLSIKELQRDKASLDLQKERIENLLQNIQSNNETCVKVKKMIKQDIESTISNPRRLLQFALASIFESSRKHPGRLHAMYYNMPTIRTIKRSSSEIPIVDCQDYQQVQYVYQYTSDYVVSENLLLDEAEQLYNRLIEESMSACAIKGMTETTDKTKPSTHSLQPTELDMHIDHTREEDHTNSDANENDLLMVKVTDPREK